MPSLGRVAPLVERGEAWTDEQIDDELDLTRTSTCEHLHEIERAIRAAGIVVRRFGGQRIDAACTIDPAALAARFALPEFVGFREDRSYDRSPHDPPACFVRCERCRSLITARHDEVAAPGTPRFPAPLDAPAR